MPVNEKMVRKGTKFFCNNLITNTLSLRQPIAKGLVEAVVGSDNAADFSASVANRGVGALQLGAGGEEGLVVEEFVVHQGWYFLATVAHEGLSLQEGHVHAALLVEIDGHTQHAVNQARGAVGQGVKQPLGTGHHVARLALGAVAGRKGEQ